jgi:hypothetical protein
VKRDPVKTAALREAVRTASSKRLDALTCVPRVASLDAASFAAFAAGGVPFVACGLVDRWPISKLTLHTLETEYGHLKVSARVGDYVKNAFSKARESSGMSLADYLKLVMRFEGQLPPYLGNQALPQLTALCDWPPFFSRPGSAQIWFGPANTVTPLHCDFTDNLFAQILGRKHFLLCPPHADEFLYTREANPVLYGSRFDPETPDYDKYPLARDVRFIECTVNPGDLLFLPAGWFHKVRSRQFSLSANRWSLDSPFALRHA